MHTREGTCLYHLRMQIHGQTHDILFSQQEVWQACCMKIATEDLQIMHSQLSSCCGIPFRGGWVALTS